MAASTSGSVTRDTYFSKGAAYSVLGGRSTPACCIACLRAGRGGPETAMLASLAGGRAGALSFAREVAMALRIAGRALSRHVLRTTLTAVGIAIGTSAVIATVAIGQGGAAQIHEQLL